MKRRSNNNVTFDSAFSIINEALSGSFRQEYVDELASSKNLDAALHQLRHRMQSHTWKVHGHNLQLDQVVTAYDRQTRLEGFHVLNDWNGIADQINENIIPVDVLDYAIDNCQAVQSEKTVLAVLLDYYFLYILGLLSMRVWDNDNADENLDRLNETLAHLQGPLGSGQRFVDNAETLILLATSHYELEERGYGILLDKVRALNQPHRLNIALQHAASIGCHLRFGFEATYARDTLDMRNDNVADYPWLYFALAVVMREYVRIHENGCSDQGEREAVVEALLNGLSPDTKILVSPPAKPFSTVHETERAEFCEHLHSYKDTLLEECKPHRPSMNAYSPMGFFFNFSQNVVKGTVTDALLWGDAWTVTLNDLLTGISPGQPSTHSKMRLANTLMGYARAHPHKIRGQMMPVIVYDPQAGHRAYAETVRQLHEVGR